MAGGEIRSGERATLFAVFHYPPSSAVGAQRSARFARHLPALGWTPVVLSVTHEARDGHAEAGADAPSSYTAGVFRPLDFLGRLRRQTRKRPKTAAPDSQPAAASQAKRPRRGWLTRWVEPWFTTPDADVGWVPAAVAVGWRAVKRHRPRVLFTSGPPHSSHLVGWTLSRLTGLPWIADFRDPWTRRPWLDASRRQGVRYRIEVALERAIVRRASRVILNTDRMAEEFRQHYSQWPLKFQAIPNAYDDEAVIDVRGLEVPRSGPLVVTHAGSLYRRRSPEPMLRAVGSLKARGLIQPGTLLLRFVGHTDDDFSVETIVRSLGIEAFVDFIPKVAHRQSLELLARSHVLLLIQPGTAVQVPAKLFEYAFMDRPILALTGPGATRDLMNEYELGWVAAPDDVDCIVERLALAIRMRDEGRFPAVRNDAFRSHFSGRSMTARLAAVFEAATRNAP